MNLPNRDYELSNTNYTSDYNPGLINPKINTFFNDVLNKPDPVYTSVIKTDQSWNKFYKDYEFKQLEKLTAVNFLNSS